MAGVRNHDDEQGGVERGAETSDGVLLEELRLALSTCEKERKEYLDGWRRARADAVNDGARRTKLLESERSAALGRYALAMLPILDSIRGALSEFSDTVTLAGIERIHTQCVRSFAAVGVDLLDPVGETFDPHCHQALGERAVGDVAAQGTVVAVGRVGARVGEVVIRAAEVYIGVFTEDSDSGVEK